jgi:membrane protein YdbS with pleckstrin-like domain
VTAYLLRLLRVPAEPDAPDGSPESIRIFRAGRNYYRWRLIVWGFSQLVIVLSGFAFLGAFAWTVRKLPPIVYSMMVFFDLLAVLFLVLALPFSYFLQRLNYELRWYIVTDRSLRIRSGIWSVEEITMTFANIQDLRITAGPLQGWLGIADLEVSSAGGGGASTGGKHPGASDSHTARFAGVDNAVEIRDLIVERLKRYRDAGLGDAPVDMAGAAAALLAEAKALRQTVTAVEPPSTASV